MRLGQELARRHVFAPIFCAWTVNVLGLGVGAWLMWRAWRR
jgi:lipopolysaccharide export LptBFGC system permease protein LptF